MKLKTAPTTLPMIAGNASAAFPTSLLSAFTSLSNHFFSRPLRLLMENLLSPPPAPPTLPRSPMTESTIVVIPAKRTVSVEIIVTIYSGIKVRILSGKCVFLSRTFSMVYLILATCVWRSFRFCDNISNLACFSVFKSSNLSLYNCLCSSL